MGRHAISPIIFRLHRRRHELEVPVSVHMLVSSQTWDAGILAAISFENFSGRRWPLFIHEDGSVTKIQQAIIQKTLPGVRFVPRTEAEERMAGHLAKHPKSLSNRNRHNLFLKFSIFQRLRRTSDLSSWTPT